MIGPLQSAITVLKAIAMAGGLYLVHPGFLLALGGYVLYQIGDAEANMLAMTEGGTERTLAEFAALFESAGLKLETIHQTEGMMSVIEAVKS